MAMKRLQLNYFIQIERFLKLNLLKNSKESPQKQQPSISKKSVAKLMQYWSPQRFRRFARKAL